MFLPLVHVNKTLYKRLDKGFIEVARDEMLALMAEQPALVGREYIWSMRLDEDSSGASARLSISIKKRRRLYTFRLSHGILVSTATFIAGVVYIIVQLRG